MSMRILNQLEKMTYEALEQLDEAPTVNMTTEGVRIILELVERYTELYKVEVDKEYQIECFKRDAVES